MQTPEREAAPAFCVFGRALKNLSVVPANAGTHNHRSPLLQKVSTRVLEDDSRGVWVPAFAGTTENYPPSAPWVLT